MAAKPCMLLSFLIILSIGVAMAAEWSILDYMIGRMNKDVGISLKNYCESWRINVDLNNIQGFDVVPGECADLVGKYMTSTQYKADVQRAGEEVSLFLTNNFVRGRDRMDAWVFDVDDTLLATVPYYKKHQFGDVLGCRGAEANRSSLDAWMRGGNAPAVEHMLNLYEDVKGRGLKIIIISSRGEHLRDATVDNLIKAGYRGWTELILRCEDDDNNGSIQGFKTEQRKKMVKKGYRLWGIVGDQWSSLLGLPNASRTFKLPNPMYYDV